MTRKATKSKRWEHKIGTHIELSQTAKLMYVYMSFQGERRPLPCINFNDSACPAELSQWLSW